MGNFWESSELKCAAGVGLSALGIGIAVPIAAEACTEVVENVRDQIVAKSEASHGAFHDFVCRPSESVPSYAELLFGAFSPITTLTVPYTEAVCEHSHPLSKVSSEMIGDLITSALPLMGPAGLLAEGINQAIQGQIQTEDLFRTFGETLLGSVMLLGATRTLRRVSAERLKHVMRGTEVHHLRFRQFKKLDHKLNPEVLEQLRRIK